MANETLKAGFDAYMAKADAASAKFPANSGPCVCMLVSPLLKNPTNGIVTC